MAWVPSGSSASPLTLGRKAGPLHAAPAPRILTLQQAQVHLWLVGKSVFPSDIYLQCVLKEVSLNDQILAEIGSTLLLK